MSTDNLMNTPRDTPAVDPAGAPRQPGWVRYQVLAWLCLAATIAYISRNSIAVAASTIQKDLVITDHEMGLVLSAFFLTYALFSIPAGWLGHLLGTRRALPVFSTCWSVATASMGYAWGLPMLLATRLANGATQSGLFPCCTNTIAGWFPGARRAVASGMLASFMSVGGAVGAALTGVMIGPLGWRWTFAIYSALGALWALGFYLWFRDAPEDHPSVGPPELALIRGGGAGGHHADRRPPPTPWRAIFSSPAMAWISGQQFFRAAGYIFFASWFATYLQKARGVTVAESGFLSSLPLMGVVLGSLIGGTVSDWVLARTGSRRLARQGVSVASLLTCAVLVFLAYTIQDEVLAVLVISTGSFFASIAGPCAYTITIDMGGSHVATVFSTMNMAGNIGATVFPYIVPWFREWTDWDSVLLLFGAMYVGAALCWLLLNPAGTIFDQARVHPEKEASADGPS